MNNEIAMTLVSDTLWTAIKLTAPLIGLSTLVAVLISILQSVTQIQESSLTFVPRLVTAAAVLLALGGWMLTVLTQFATRLIANIPSYL